jgi:hypothetical protein
LRIKEQETRLTIHEHDDGDDEMNGMEWNGMEFFAIIRMKVHSIQVRNVDGRNVRRVGLLAIQSSDVVSRPEIFYLRLLI